MTRTLLFLVAAALAACAPYLVVKRWPDARPTRVVVLPFKDAPGAPGSGALAEAAFKTRLLAVPTLELVERGALPPGGVDEAKAAELARAAGADAAVLGEVTSWTERHLLIFPPAQVAVSAEMVDARTGTVAWTASQHYGGYKRLLTWVIWPIGAVATAVSPTADAQLQDASRSICEALAKTAPAGEAAPVPSAPAASAPEAASASNVDSPRYRAAERPDDYAVVVGIENYSDLPAARFADRDAAAVKAHFRALGVPERNIAYLSDAKAGRSSIQKYVEDWLPRLVKDDSRVYFYFSGHGAPDVKTGSAYLVPWDGDANYLATTGYPLDRLYGKLGALGAKEVLVAMDTCFSGAGGRSVLPSGARPLVTVSASSGVPAKVVALTASSGQEISGTEDAAGHGLFTYYFLMGLNGGAKVETPRGLYDYLKPLVQDEARRGNRDQTPQLLGEASGMRLR